MVGVQQSRPTMRFGILHVYMHKHVTTIYSFMGDMYLLLHEFVNISTLFLLVSLTAGVTDGSATEDYFPTSGQEGPSNPNHIPSQI